MKRDLATISNIPGFTKQDFEQYANKLLKNVPWEIQSHEFIISPSFEKNNPAADNLDPHKEQDINKLIKYSQLFLHECFDGHFIKTDSYFKNGHKRYHYKYIFPSKNDDNRFPFILDIQPDSSKHARLHGHAVLINKDLVTGKAMSSNYYGIQHIRKSIHQATELWNNQHPNDTISDIAHHNRQGRKPSDDVKHIINALNNANKNMLVKSQRALISYLKPYGVDAKRTKKTKRKRAGWKFRYQHNKYIKASKLATYQGAKEFSSQGIKDILAKHRKSYGKSIKQKKLATKKIEHKQSSDANEINIQPSMASISLSNSISTNASNSTSSAVTIVTTPTQVFRSTHDSIDSSYSYYTKSLSNSVFNQAQENQPSKELKNAYNYALDYENTHSTVVINHLMPKLSSDTVRKATPQVIRTYQTQSIDKRNGLKEFYVISNGLRFTRHDNNAFNHAFGKFSNAIRTTTNRFKKSNLYNSLDNLYTSAVKFCKQHFNTANFSIHHIMQGLKPKYKQLLSKWHPLKNSHIKNFNNSLKNKYSKSFNTVKGIDHIIANGIKPYSDVAEPILSMANNSASSAKAAMSSTKSASSKASRRASTDAMNKALQQKAQHDILLNRAQNQYYLKSSKDVHSVLANTDIGRAITSTKPSNYGSLSTSLFNRDMDLLMKYPSPNGFPVMTPERYQIRIAQSYIEPKAQKYSESSSIASRSRAQSKARTKSIREDYKFSKERSHRISNFARRHRNHEQSLSPNKSKPSHENDLTL